MYSVDNYPVIEYPSNPIALGSCWLTYPDIKLNTHHQSEEGVSMKAKMLDAMKGVGKVASEVYNKYWKGEEVSSLVSGMLLLTACSEGRVFNLFCIHPHPWLSSETCVQHLYSLRRGDTRGLVHTRLHHTFTLNEMYTVKSLILYLTFYHI